MLMCIPTLVIFWLFILKILSGNQLFTESQKDGKTESRNDRMTEGQGESSIAPLFQGRAIITETQLIFRAIIFCNFVAMHIMVAIYFVKLHN